MNNHLVIMAGGIGSRFWPMSTPECPKQFIDVLGCGRTLIQLTVDRFKGICPAENIWVVTSKKYVEIVHEQLPEIPDANILQEPCMRNTAPCVAYVSWKIQKKDPEANIVVTSSDQFVVNVPEFQRVIKASLDFAQTTNAILTLGMKPTRPETGYGYIEAMKNDASSVNKEIFRVSAFKEKPNLEVALNYIAQPNFYWNAGIFIWKVSAIVNALREFQPEIASIFDKLVPYIYSGQEQEMVDKYFPECMNISIDYAIMEKSKNIFVFPADFGWSDLGTWGSLYGQLSHDEQGNACVGENICMIESSNCVVHTAQEKKVVIQGLDGYIVAEKDGTLLVCKLEEEQRIKEFSQS